ncbi:PREDICTED: filament-like plant protein 3 [Tarenaya hassleriana]|uniref:filament-like plant protein 3 n=1 Tax=Tarenaya hassleriana TaxID=28532 RepID=UPI00053C78F3|nr:PREDICTED: filament-like plant protein 3 [Tarenaya hassleriana]XP_010547871.1 PREDICTED: filament-like plant protein 3 [Tarenaya hassleriana]
MDRRSWLWRRKSSEKSPGETESSGSISSHSERFSDDQRSQSPDLTSKAATMEEDVTADIKTLSEKLSSALLNVSLKEELVKQHARVAEEAVSGWEKAEKEVSALKQQLEASVSKNSALEDRVGHLDCALKECVRQLRQGREDQDQKIQEAVNKRCQELEIRKSELETQVEELRAKEGAAASVYNDLHPKLELLERENSTLKLQLVSKSEELEIRTIERDLSTQAAESASKQQLEGIKKLTKLEAECRKLKAMARKSSNYHDRKSQLDNQFDDSEKLSSTENDTSKTRCDTELSTSEKVIRKTLNSPKVEINLMDDFLEMEKLAALPDPELGNRHSESGKASEKPNAQLKHELETSLCRISELEEKVEMVEVEKLQLEMALDESRTQIEALQSQLRDTEGKLSELRKMSTRNQELEMSLAESEKQLEDLQNQLNKAQVNSSDLETTKAEKLELAICLNGTKKQLEASQNRLRDTEKKITDLQTLLRLANDAKEAAEENEKAANFKMETAETRLRDVEAEAKALTLKISSLEDSVEMERVLSSKHLAQCQELKDEISKLKHEVLQDGEDELYDVKGFDDDFKLKQDKELAAAAAKFAECQKTIASLGERLKSLATLEDFLLESEDPSTQKNLDDGQLNLTNTTNSESSNRSREYINDSPRNRSHEEVSLPSAQFDSSSRSRNGLERFLNRGKSVRRM